VDERHAKHNKKRDPFMAMRLTIAAASTLLLCAPVAHAGLTEFGNGEREAWFDAAGGAANVTTIDFTGYSDGTPLNDQYQHLGVTFTDGSSFFAGESFLAFPQDGWGVQDFGLISFAFDSPQNAVAVDYPGAVQLGLFHDGIPIDVSSEFIETGYGNFAGIISTESFDAVEVIDPTGGDVAFDDLHFAQIPTPPSMLPLMAILLGARRRRCGKPRNPCSL